MTLPPINSLPPDEAERQRVLWRESQRLRQARRKGEPEASVAECALTVRKELRAILRLLRETVDKRPERFMEILLECQERLITARIHTYDQDAIEMLDDVIAILELLKRRQI